MKPASDAYKKEMLDPWRGQWLFNLYVGLINEDFQATGKAKMPFEPILMKPWVDKDFFRSEALRERRHPTFEKDVFTANAYPVFIMKDNHLPLVTYQGMVSKALSNDEGRFNTVEEGCLIISNEDESVRGINGLTLFFSEEYPTELRIKVFDSKSVLVFDKKYTNDSMTFTTVDKMSDIGTTIRIEMIKLNKPNVRVRIDGCMIGIGYVFNNDMLMSSGLTYTNIINSRSLELSTQTLSFSVDNFMGDFDFDNPDTFLHLIKPGKDVSLQIGYKQNNGKIEYLPKETLEISNFSLNDNTLQIDAVDFLANENEVVSFKDPAFFKEGTTLYDLAREVLKYFKNKTFTVDIDDSLNSVYVEFIESELSVKEALMKISSAGCCVMEFTPKGVAIRRRAIKGYQFGVTYRKGNKLYYSDVEIIDRKPKTLFATFENKLCRADGVPRFLKDKDSLPTEDTKTGYIGNDISYIDKDGRIKTNTGFSVHSEVPISPSYITIKFNNTIIGKIRITTYSSDIMSENLIEFGDGSDTFHFMHDFKAFDSMYITIESIRTLNHRVYVDYVSFDDDVTQINKELIIDRVPKGELLEPVRDLYVKYAYSAEDGDGRLDIEDSIKVHCNDKGSDIEYENPFVTNEETAKEVMKWLKDYYETEIVYDFEWIGDPTLEVEDLINIPNAYNSGAICEIEENTITFSNGGLRGTIKARRYNNGTIMDKTKNKLDSR